MAFEITDFHNDFIMRGDIKGTFNAARQDVSSVAIRYYAYLNENGAYIIQRTRTTSTAGISIIEYYGRKNGSFATDWAGRAALSYVEYNALFTN